MSIDYATVALTVSIVAIFLATIIISPSLLTRQAQSWFTGLVFIGVLSLMVSAMFFLIKNL